jgi:hypothetical protein
MTEQPNHIGIVRDRDGKGYVITAEYRDGYEILAKFKTKAAAEAMLPELQALRAAAPAFAALLREQGIIP